MRRFLLVVLSCGASAAGFGQSTQDRGSCSDPQTPPPERAEACNRLLTSGQLSTLDSAAAYYHRGLARASQSDLDGAIGDYTAAFRLDPHLAAAVANRGLIWNAKGDFRKAVADFDSALQVEPTLNRVYGYRAYAGFSAGNFSAAAEDFGIMSRLNPNDANSVVFRAIALARVGHEAEARSELQAALRSIVGQEWPAPLVQFWLHEVNAAGLLKKADGPGQSCAAAFSIGEFYVVQGKGDSAKAMLRRAKRDCPADRVELGWATQELKRVDSVMIAAARSPAALVDSAPPVHGDSASSPQTAVAPPNQQPVEKQASEQPQVVTSKNPERATTLLGVLLALVAGVAGLYLWKARTRSSDQPEESEPAPVAADARKAVIRTEAPVRKAAEVAPTVPQAVRAAPPQADQMTCPFCGQSIRVGASICRYCREPITAAAVAPEAPAAAAVSPLAVGHATDDATAASGGTGARAPKMWSRSQTLVVLLILAAGLWLWSRAGGSIVARTPGAAAGASGGSCSGDAAEAALLQAGRARTVPYANISISTWQVAGPCSFLATGVLGWRDQLSGEILTQSFSGAVSRNDNGYYVVDMFQITGQ